MRPRFHPGMLSAKQNEILRVSGFDPAKGQGWPLMVQGPARNSARILASRYELGRIEVDADGFAHFTATIEGCRIHYPAEVAQFEENSRW